MSRLDFSSRLFSEVNKIRKKAMNDHHLDSLVKAILSVPRGEIVKIKYARQAKKRASYQTLDIVKESTITCRFVDYGIQKAVIQAKANGRRDQPNNWQSLQDDCPGLFRDHKGNLKVCVGAPINANQIDRQHKWRLNGNPIAVETIKSFLLKSELSNPPADWFTLNAECITHVGNCHIARR